MRTPHEPAGDHAFPSTLLATLQHELDDLVAERLLVPFAPGRQERYEELCQLETRLCLQLGYADAI